jgi:biotin-dependent carboxylase-like uncharacterized protein
VITVVGVAGMVTVQDGGRPGHMHEGVPPGGALVPELLARANLAASNAPFEAALEVLGSVTLSTDGLLRVASDEGTARELQAGQTWTVACGPARVRYVAIRGGIDVPRLLGGRGTLLVASLGGHHGRILRRGDGLQAGSSPQHEGAAPEAPDAGAPIQVVPGPDLDCFAPDALERLGASSFVVDARSDRVGIRLSGPAIPRTVDDRGVSGPMVRGAVQVPPSGPIVLGPDHPTTGGYPVLATVVRASLGTLCARPVGAPVRFALRSA